jgi:putative drug exporter of the RND superfamily
MSPARQRRRPASSDRLARALRRFRWPVVILWLVAIVVLHPFSSSLSQVTNDTASAYLPSSAPSTRVALLQEGTQTGPGQPETNAAIVVFVHDGGLTPADLTAIDAARTAVGNLAGKVTGLTAPGSVQRSPDGAAAQFTANVTAPADNTDTADQNAVKAIRAAVNPAQKQVGDLLRVDVTGAAAVNADSSSSNAQTTLLLTALVIVAVILLLVYRSPLLWLFPLIGAIGAIVVAQSSAHGLVNAGLTVSTLSSSILIVLVFGAASDYALLLVHRYREELRHRATTEDAMAEAMRRTLPTLIASAATVTCAMICLLVAESASLHGLGPVGAVGIVSALLAQTTFLPALLLVIGRAAFWPRIPRAGRSGREESRIWSGIGTRVARHPAWVALVAVVLLGAACAGLASLRIDNNPVDNVKGNPGSVAGDQLLAEHFPAGEIAPLVILAPPDEATAAVAAVRATRGIATVLPGSGVQGYRSYSAIMSGSPFGSSGTSIVVNLRSTLDRDAPGTLVGGNPAIYYDVSQAAGRDSLVIIPLVLLVILIIIGLLLQAIIAPIVLVITTALSFAASFGLSSLLWLHAFGYKGIQSTIPLYIFIFLVALGVDYNIFMSARIREETRRLGTTKQGTLRGLSVTGGVITAAGIVLAGTFAALAQLPSVAIAEVGVAVALGVLIDTLLVRTVLVPAALLTIGDRVWWPSRSRGSGEGQDRSPSHHRVPSEAQTGD